MYGKAQWVQYLARPHASNHGQIVKLASALGLQATGHSTKGHAWNKRCLWLPAMWQNLAWNMCHILLPSFGMKQEALHPGPAASHHISMAVSILLLGLILARVVGS